MSRFSLVALVASVLLSTPLLATADTMLYVSDEQASTIHAIAANGTDTILASGLGDPEGLAFDTSGNLFVASLSGTISKITPDTTVSTFVTFGVTEQPYGLAFDGSGNLYTSNGYTGTISKITPGGSISTFATQGGGSGLAFDSLGNLYGVGGSGIIKITPGGIISTFAPGLNGGGMAFDNSGDLCLSQYPGTILKISPSGVVSTFITGLDSPLGLAFDSSGNLYADNLNTVNRITPGGSVSTFARIASSSMPGYIAVAPAYSTLVPEPASVVLLASAAGLLILRRSRAGRS